MNIFLFSLFYSRYDIRTRINMKHVAMLITTFRKTVIDIRELFKLHHVDVECDIMVEMYGV